MIQSVKKASDVLTLIAGYDGDSVRLSVIASSLGMNTSTCAHIVGTLTNEGFLRRVNHRDGYVLGLNIYRLTQSDKYISILREYVKPELEKFTERTGELILAAILYGDKKWIISHSDVTHDEDLRIVIQTDKPEGNITDTPTGRVLLAYASDSELRHYVDKNQMPNFKERPPFLTFSEFKKELKKIHECNVYTIDNFPMLFHAAVPVNVYGFCTVALGTYFARARYTDEYRDKIYTQLLESADNIKNHLMGV